jgi:pyridoxal phosphate enzyme (YggS family)
MKSIKENLELVETIIVQGAKKFNRCVDDINLVAVSKKQPIDRIYEMLQCGHRLYGENRVQEAQERWLNLRPDYPDLKLHLIGPLQTNKVRDAVALFDVIETLDRPKLAKAIGAEMKKQNKSIPCFIQINTGEEDQKSGIMPHELESFLALCRDEDLNIIGLMCIPPQADPPAMHFAFLQKLAKQYDLKHLSMGMSSDFERAIPLGATYIRVGTALFGKRPSQV